MSVLSKTRCLLLAVCLAALSAAALPAAPRITGASAAPPTVAPGKSVQLTCAVADAEGAVSALLGSVREQPSYRLRFARQDESWVCTIPVPRDTPPGTYHIDLTLVGRDGKPIAPAAGSVTGLQVAVTSPAAAPGEEQRRPAAAQPAPGVQTYMVPMRDGVRLATDVRLGQGEGPWPVILLRTPYGRKGGGAGGLAEYAVVVQDVRGRYDSEGHALAFFDDGWGERQDGLDTVKWILAQPWCNGKIGTMGGSALGITQHMLAGANPPGVLCQQIVFAAGSLYHGAAYPGGALREDPAVTWLRHWPEDNVALVRAHPFYDEWWQAVDANARIRQLHIDLPAIHVGGWFDVFAQGTIDSFRARSEVSRNQWLIMGPWPHGMSREVGELMFPPNAMQPPAPGLNQQLWFDHWLRGRDKGLLQTPRVHYYVMGACGEPGAPGNEWRSADSWPIPAAPTEFFLGPAGQLLRQAPEEAGALTYDYDPAHPVPTRGGGNLSLKRGPMDQREVEQRPDVLVFSTAPLEQPLEVTGLITVRLYASSSARDTLFTAKLCDVYPDGRSMLITDGALRAACRESVSHPTPLEPGRTYQLNLEIGSTSIIFNRGHRIRVSISSSNHPRFAVHPNVWGEGKPQVAHQTIYCGGSHASALILPVVGK